MDPTFQTLSANSASKTFDKGTIATYLTFAAAFLFVYHWFGPTFVHTLDHMLTAAAALQLCALCILAVKVYQFKTVEGVSYRMLIIYLVSFSMRLSSTLFFPGYLPEDGTADVWLYQIIEILGLAVCLWLIYQITGPCCKTFDDINDCMPFWWSIIIISVVLALFTHSDANQNKLFDVFWMTSQYLDSLSMMPQLFMIAQCGRVERWTSHFVAWTVVSRVLLGFFWILLQTYHSFAEWPFTVGMVFSIIVQMVLSADYMYYFIKTFRQAEMTLGL